MAARVTVWVGTKRLGLAHALGGSMRRPRAEQGSSSRAAVQAELAVDPARCRLD
jgi:hypothetical protein